MRRREGEGEFVVQAAIRVAYHLVFVHDEKRRTFAGDEAVLLGFKCGDDDGGAQIFREVARGDADIPATCAPLSEFVIGKGTGRHGVDGLATWFAAMRPQFEDERLARTGRRLHDDILAFAQRGHGLLLPQVRDGDLVQGGQLGELRFERLHARKIMGEVGNENLKVGPNSSTKAQYLVVCPKEWWIRRIFSVAR